MRRKNNLPFFVVVMHVMQIILKSLEFSNGQDDGWSHHLPLLAMDSFIDANRSIFVVFNKTGLAWFLQMTSFW
jgi:hypothetical protein